MGDLILLILKLPFSLLVLNTKNALQQYYKGILTEWWAVILVARGPFLLYSTAAQIITIHHITYQHNNHQQILTYKRVRCCLLTLLTFPSILNITLIKLNSCDVISAILHLDPQLIEVYLFPRLRNTVLVSNRVTLTSRGEGASLALISHLSSNGVTINMPYGLDVLLHWPASHHIFFQWVG